MPRNTSPTERQEQRAYVSWFYKAYPGERLAKFCNEGRRTAAQTRLLISEGLYVGVPDIVVCTKRAAFGALFIEMKRRRGGIASDAQKLAIAHLNANGYLALICRGWDEAREATIKYMQGEKL